MRSALNDKIFSRNFARTEGERDDENPLMVLIFFLHFFSNFDWTAWAVSAVGLISIKSMDPVTTEDIISDTIGKLGTCDEKLSEIILSCREALHTNINSSVNPQCTTPSTSQPLTLPPTSEPTSTFIENYHEKLKSEFDTLPSDLREDEICVFHPLKAQINLCRDYSTVKPEPSITVIIIDDSDDDIENISGMERCRLYTQNDAMRALFSFGFQRLSDSVRSSTVSQIDLEPNMESDLDSDEELDSIAVLSCVSDSINFRKTTAEKDWKFDEIKRQDSGMKVMKSVPETIIQECFPMICKSMANSSLILQLSSSAINTDNTDQNLTQSQTLNTCPTTISDFNIFLKNSMVRLLYFHALFTFAEISFFFPL